MQYLGLCAIFKAEWHWLREWVIYHRARGVDHFFMYNHDDDPQPAAALLHSFVEEGLVTLLRPPTMLAPQLPAYREALLLARSQFCWLGFLDLDEFLLPKQTDSLPELLSRYEAYPALAVNWQIFGSAGLSLRPPTQINHFTSRGPLTLPQNSFVKVIVNPALVRDIRDPHCCDYARGYAVAPCFTPVTNWLHDPPCHEIVQINHYRVRSLADRADKRDRGIATRGGLRDAQYFANNDCNDCNTVFDDEISRRFGHEVRDCNLSDAPTPA